MSLIKEGEDLKGLCNICDSSTLLFHLTFVCLVIAHKQNTHFSFMQSWGTSVMSGLGCWTILRELVNQDWPL